MPWLGDLLALCGAALYAATNVSEEAVVRADGRAVYFANVGLYGALLSVAQCAAIERRALAAALEAARANPLEVLALEAGFVSSLVLFYLLAGTLLQAGSSAVLMNLSLLGADFYSLLAGVFLLHSRLSAWCVVISPHACVCGFLQ